MENQHNRGAGAVLFLAGVVAGGVTALLLAPQSGAQMRSRLKRGAHDLREKGGNLAHKVDEKVVSVSGAVKSAASEARNTYRDEMDKSRTASGMESKRESDADAVGVRSRAGAQS